MRDGVVAFEEPDAAARYATRLEEEGETKVRRARAQGGRGVRGAPLSSCDTAGTACRRP
jgi:hypothetical protein